MAETELLARLIGGVGNTSFFFFPVRRGTRPSCSYSARPIILLLKIRSVAPSRLDCRADKFGTCQFGKVALRSISSTSLVAAGFSARPYALYNESWASCGNCQSASWRGWCLELLELSHPLLSSRLSLSTAINSRADLNIPVVTLVVSIRLAMTGLRCDTFWVALAAAVLSTLYIPASEFFSANPRDTSSSSAPFARALPAVSRDLSRYGVDVITWFLLGAIPTLPVAAYSWIRQLENHVTRIVDCVA